MLLASALSLALVVSGSGGALAAATSLMQPEEAAVQPAALPDDRYALAGNCYAMRAADGGYVERAADGFSASGDGVAAAEPFHLQATDLGRYLLYGNRADFLAASEGALARAAYTVTRSSPGATAGGVAMEQTDAAADTLADSEANRASGRGESVIAATDPSDLADWAVAEAGHGAFSLYLRETDQSLVVGNDATLSLVDGEEGDAFVFEPTTGCAEWPEIKINVEGLPQPGASSIEEVRGYLDAHLHLMAFEFLGGRARCGRPWHRFGVDHALVDCPDHEPGGHGSALEYIVSRNGDPVNGHDTDGWPTFAGWPRYNSLTHEQAYYKWLERARRGGLRLFTNLLVDNNQLCKVYPFKRNSCNEMDGVALQARRIRELQDYIDAQNGGPGRGWFRIVTDPFQAREVINAGKLAVVLGIEVSVPLNCGLGPEHPKCEFDDVDRGLDYVYDKLGVRQMELVNKFDNEFSGVAGDSGDTGMVVNQGNKAETTHYWKMETCTEADGHAHDKTQHNLPDASGSNSFTGRDALAGAIFNAAGTSGAVPIYPEGPHCNVLGLSDLGRYMIEGMAKRGMIFDPDHMSARAQTEALDLLDEMGYSGVVSSHGWSNETIYPRIYELGGVVTPYAGRSDEFVRAWRDHREWADPRFYFGFGYGSDVNGFGAQGGPRPDDAGPPVTYPFTGLGGVQVDQQVSGERTYDINTDGVAHYGLYPDWIEDLRMQAGDEIVADMARGAEAYLQMWERAIGIPPDACRTDVADLTPEDLHGLRRGMTVEEVLRALGQPSSRVGDTYSFCWSGGVTQLRFDPEGRLVEWDRARGKGHSKPPKS